MQTLFTVTFFSSAPSAWHIMYCSIHASYRMIILALCVGAVEEESPMLSESGAQHHVNLALADN